ncbi:hypothetical protein BEWA_003990 [Theileria equi strain WA]|uniref:Inner centromere protein ARK-binding domain-containing protein n=1 Tax=Theileria equi strain WA TaxID=1537102 RepID=L0B178_THEEQ|nr:hypothetical protein BEWA_003990 [Theileria equi strain WA]AFZ80991.1 hypothetical protein BEWA_003990 [Theileria equi strain WA]|eukprot:XP_004830657.1 hypothetical protein BEWA_003990 [Theileria equi strain WA]
MATIVRIGPSFTPKRSQNASHSSGLIVTGAIDDPFCISSELTPSIGSRNGQGSSCREPMSTPETRKKDLVQGVFSRHASKSTSVEAIQPLKGFLSPVDKSEEASEKGSRSTLYSDSCAPVVTLEDGRQDDESTQTVLESSASSETPATNAQFYTCKQMIEISPKRIEDNYDLPLFFLIRFGGPASSVGASVLRDGDLLKTSILSKLSYEEMYRYYACMYKRLHDNVMAKNCGKNLDKTKLHRKMSREIPTKTWQNRENLYSQIVTQSTWNPFSIFGSSPPYASLQDIFNIKSIQDYVTPDVFGRMCRVLGHTRHTLLEYLERHWKKESYTANWKEDPLLHEEVVWYLKATGKTVDKSESVYTLQKCYCVTPNPNIRYNWNDPRNAHINQERRRISTWQPMVGDEEIKRIDVEQLLEDIEYYKRSREECSDLCGGYLESPQGSQYTSQHGHTDFNARDEENTAQEWTSAGKRLCRHAPEEGLWSATQFKS